MKSRRKRKPRKGRRKGIFVLPNLFTSASLFGGFYAIIASIHGRYEAAAIAIIISCVFDGLDGNEYDSLSDLVAFGVAPAILAYLWALEPFGRLGWLAAFMYVICGALRLARFNVQKDNVDAKFFNGLPIPAAACFIASLVLFTKALGGITQSKPIIIIVMIYLLSFLMVSTINYLSFKEVNIRHRKPFHVLVSIILIFTVIAYKPQVMLFIIMLSYIVSGPVVTLYRLHGKRSQAREAAAIGGESRDQKAVDQGSVKQVDTT
jgi:CDP-diacylglycerol--serine O-phosphatidyltransferase